MIWDLISAEPARVPHRLERFVNGAFGQQTAVVRWRLQHDNGIREVFYETDADLINRFFVSANSLQRPSC